MKKLDFNIPFSGFCGTTFINCFTSTYMFLEGIAGNDDYDCKKKRGEKCDGCGNCRGSSKQLQEKWFFLFDTVCGRSSLRCRFDGEPTEMQKMVGEPSFYDGGSDNNVDFLFGFAGYDYSKLIEPSDFRAAVEASVGTGKPALARVKSGDGGRFRVITGYDGEVLSGPNYAGAQKPPKEAPSYGDIDALYIIGGKQSPRYTLIDGLKRIETIMEYNQAEKLWDGYMQKMGLYTSDSLSKVDAEEKKRRMKRVAATMWHTFNCHNFAEVFRHPIIEELNDPTLKNLYRPIGGPGPNYHGYTHDLAWALIGLEERADWTKRADGYFGEMVELVLMKIRDNDAGVLKAVKEMIKYMENK